MKKLKFLIPMLGVMMLASCGTANNSQSIDLNHSDNVEAPINPLEGKSDAYKTIYNLSDTEKKTLSSGGMVGQSMNDYSKYVGTEAYKEVSTAEELLQALKEARLDYSTQMNERLTNHYVVRNNVRKNETNWQNALKKGLFLKNDDGTFTKIATDTPFSDTTYTTTMVYYEESPHDLCSYTQTLNQEGKVHVIEIKNDINLGYKKLTDAAKETGLVNNWIDEKKAVNVTMSSMANENGISQISVERTNDLIVYSKNGAKLTHGGFKVNYCDNVTFRNLDMDEMWQWEDTSNKKIGKMGDYDTFGWAYFKIGYSDNVWIDHCSFGKSFDGQIDVANPFYQSVGTYQCAPYGADGTSDVHISWCDFHAGSNKESGYIYKMMDEIEQDYINSELGLDDCHYLYYRALRNAGLSAEDILNGIAVPQKKAFLDCDSSTEYYYNLNLNLSIANCRFKNIEDRIPKVRGGNIYMYNTIVDNFEYISYRLRMKDTAIGAVAGVNSTWKCAFVSQGIVCGNGGSVMAQNCIFRGIEDLIKNNDKTLSNLSGYEGATNNGGYKILDCTYQYTKDSEIITDSTKMPVAVKSDSQYGDISVEFFKWNTKDGNAPFTPITYSIDSLEAIINNQIYGVGAKNGFDEVLLVSDFTQIK